MERVRVWNEGNGWMGTRVTINDVPVKGVKSVDFHVGVEEAPEFEFSLFGCPDIDMAGDILFSFTPETIQGALEVLRRSFIQNDCRVYEGFVNSIESALEGCQEDMGTREKAEFIADYIIGVERR